MLSTSLHFLPHNSPSPPSTLHRHLLPPNPNPSFLLLRPSPPKPSPSPRPSLLPLASAASPSDPPPWEEASESDLGDGIEIEVVRVGVNRRRVRARVGVAAGLEIVWGVLTDYDGLAEFIPSLSVCRLLERTGNFVKIYQVGQQDLALGLKFNAKGILDCHEKDFELLPTCKRRDIDFRMVEGDFQTFEGTWSMTENDSEKCRDENFVEREFLSMLSYVVDIEPKLWLPVRLIEGRICREVRNNLSCIREEAQKIQRVVQSTLSSR